MTPSEILATIRVGFEFGTELLKWAQTEEGKAFAKQALADRAKWDSFWVDVGNGLTKFFKGDLFKGGINP